MGAQRILEPRVLPFPECRRRAGDYYSIDNRCGSIPVPLRRRNEIEIFANTAVFFVAANSYFVKCLYSYP